MKYSQNINQVLVKLEIIVDVLLFIINIRSLRVTLITFVSITFPEVNLKLEEWSIDYLDSDEIDECVLKKLLCSCTRQLKTVV